MGRDLAGVYHLLEDRIYVYEAAARGERGTNRTIEGLHSAEGREFLGDRAARFDEEIELVRGGTAEFNVDAYLRRPADAGVLRLGHLQLRRRGVVGAFLAPRAGAAAARRRAARSRVERGRAHRLRVQDPGEHGSAASRPHRLHAAVLGQVHARHAHVPRAPRQGDAHRRRAHVHGRGSQRRRRSLRGRHHRPAQPRHHQHRRHLHRGREAHVHRHPELRAGNVSPCRAQGSAQDEGARQGPRPAVRGGRHAAVQAAAQQRHDPGRRRPAAVRSGRVPPAG